MGDRRHRMGQELVTVEAGDKYSMFIIYSMFIHV